MFTLTPDASRLVEVSGTHPAMPLFQDFFCLFTWRLLPWLGRCAAAQVGIGHELASTTYDDDLDPDEEPFEGVLLIAHFRDQAIVLSRQEMDAILADFFEAVIASGARAGEPWWPALVRDARTVAARTERPLP